MTLVRTYSVGALFRQPMRMLLFKMGILDRVNYLETKWFLTSDFTVRTTRVEHDRIARQFISWQKQMDQQDI